MAASMYPPIISPMHYDPSFKVDIKLHAPLLSSGTTPEGVRLEMMSLCFQLEMLCKKELAEQTSIRNGHVSNSFIDRVLLYLQTVHIQIEEPCTSTVVCDRIQQLMGHVPPEQQDYRVYIRSQGLDRLFPRAMTYLSNPKAFSMDLEKTDLDGYFTSLSTLSQLSTLARQIHNDAANTNSHKYIAHQLALLYQVVSNIKSSTFAQHKQTIEENFKVIKATLATSTEDQPPCLTQAQQEWLLNLTSNILSILSTFPTDLTQDMILPAAILQH